LKRTKTRDILNQIAEKTGRDCLGLQGDAEECFNCIVKSTCAIISGRKGNISDSIRELFRFKISPRLIQHSFTRQSWQQGRNLRRYVRRERPESKEVKRRMKGFFWYGTEAD